MVVFVCRNNEHQQHLESQQQHKQQQFNIKQQKTPKTRLISIASKPIKIVVVVVVIDVVFVSEKVRSKKFG